MDGEDLARVFLPRLHGELVEGDVEELDGAVAAGGEELVFVCLAPRGVEEGVLRVEPLLCDDAVGREA